jgi:hypothetical protein
VHIVQLGLHIDYAHSISLGYSKEKYYLILVVDGIDFVWGQTCTTRSTPEDLIQEFLTMTNLQVSSVRFDGAQEFGKSLSFKSFCHQEKIPWNLSLIILIFKMRVRKIQSELQRNIFVVFYGLVIYPKFSGHMS